MYCWPHFSKPPIFGLGSYIGWISGVADFGTQTGICLTKFFIVQILSFFSSYLKKQG